MAVLGASGGLGGAIANVLASRGARLLLAGRDTAHLSMVGTPGALMVEAYIRDPACGTRIAAAATEGIDGLDGLVNAAGVVAFGSLEDHDDDTIEELPHERDGPVVADAKRPAAPASERGLRRAVVRRRGRAAPARDGGLLRRRKQR